jgi:hypothetical protein
MKPVGGAASAPDSTPYVPLGALRMTPRSGILSAGYALPLTGPRGQGVGDPNRVIATGLNDAVIAVEPACLG